jgi:hypothetical protein
VGAAFQHEQHVGRALAQAAHEVLKPLVSEREVNPDSVVLGAERVLEVAASWISRMMD